jgi:hypothetical protein
MSCTSTPTQTAVLSLNTHGTHGLKPCASEIANRQIDHDDIGMSGKYEWLAMVHPSVYLLADFSII